MAGINRALRHRAIATECFSEEKKPCVFLSHLSANKKAVEAVGEYIRKEGDIDIYLDKEDFDLQLANFEDDHEAITGCIERGISNSTHILCCVTEKTVKSWWVPYEIGYAKKSSKDIATLKLQKGEIYLPSFLNIGKIIFGIESLNNYITNIKTQPYKSVSNLSQESLQEGLIYHLISHPLDDYLDYDK
jgi:hypothetical protein